MVIVSTQLTQHQCHPDPAAQQRIERRGDDRRASWRWPDARRRCRGRERFAPGEDSRAKLRREIYQLRRRLRQWFGRSRSTRIGPFALFPRGGPRCRTSVAVFRVCPAAVLQPAAVRRVRDSRVSRGSATLSRGLQRNSLCFWFNVNSRCTGIKAGFPRALRGAFYHRYLALRITFHANPLSAILDVRDEFTRALLQICDHSLGRLFECGLTFAFALRDIFI